jgi:hypothetical protein
MRNHFIACSIVRREVWQQVGGFPPWRAAEDRVFMSAVNGTGGFVAIPDAIIDWIGPQTWRQVWYRTVLLAEHGARAGRAGDWHWPTLRYWLAAAVLVAILPAWTSWPLLGAGWLIRTGKRLRRHRHEPALAHASLLDWLACSVLLLVVDLAMFVGWVRGLILSDPVLPGPDKPGSGAP